MTDTIVKGEHLFLRPLATADVTDVYVGWMNDPEVTRFTESLGSHTLESVRAFVADCERDERVYFMAIMESESGKHIGNIKLGPVHPLHKVASIGIIIGEKQCWGRGYATESIELMLDYAFASLELHKVTAGCYEANSAALRAFQKAGFVVEGVQKEQHSFEGKRTGKIMLGKINRMLGEQG